MKIPDSVFIELTVEQRELLKPLFDFAVRRAQEGARGLILGQPKGDDDFGAMMVWFVDNEAAKKFAELTKDAVSKGLTSPTVYHVDL
jgi:hypothetical protein